MTKKEALAVLHSQTKGVPFEALEFLMNLPYDEDIENKIIFHLDNAYDERVAMLNESLPNLPLWYAILAEVHSSKKIVLLVINLFTIPDSPDWDLLDEQGLFLVGMFSERYPETITTFLDAIEKQVSKKSNAPYLFLYDCIYFAKDEIHGEQISRLLSNPDTGWKPLLAVHVAETRLNSCREEVKKLHEEFVRFTQKGTNENLIREELQFALELFDDETHTPGCYFHQRGDWKSHYKNAEAIFAGENPMLANIFNNVGRNDLCPCGSGKKYKNCCLKK
ncbi:MAG: SEC-C domain-containing protein [Bacteroidia bacterium]|nr:SEC-C domain-containing protein [Bacteroidia bacterium]